MYDEKEYHEHEYVHKHHHEDTKLVLNRLAKARGHLDSIMRMIESGRECSDVLIQLSAVKSAINHCIVDAVENDDKEAIKELNKAIESFF